MSADKANLWFLSLSVIDYNIYLNTLDVAVMAVNICQMKFPHYLRGCGQRIEICTAEEQIMAQFFHSKRGAATCRRSSFVFSVLHFFFLIMKHISVWCQHKHGISAVPKKCGSLPKPCMFVRNRFSSIMVLLLESGLPATSFQKWQAVHRK